MRDPPIGTSVKSVERGIWLVACLALIGWATYLWIGKGCPTIIDWGTFPDYLTGVVAAAALWYAARSAFAAAGQRDVMKEQLGVMRQEIEDGIAERTRYQATSVFLETSAGFASGREATAVTVYNLSSQPIFDTHLEIFESPDGLGQRTVRYWPVLPPTPHEGVVAGYLVRTAGEVGEPGEDVLASGEPVVRVPIGWEIRSRLRFVDSAGRPWQRKSDYTLEGGVVPQRHQTTNA